jgi:hypothetical protein
VEKESPGASTFHRQAANSTMNGKIAYQPATIHGSALPSASTIVDGRTRTSTAARSANESNNFSTSRNCALRFTIRGSCPCGLACPIGVAAAILGGASISTASDSASAVEGESDLDIAVVAGRARGGSNNAT